MQRMFDLKVSNLVLAVFGRVGLASSYPNNGAGQEVLPTPSLVLNIRMDPFESFDEIGDRSQVLQAKQWVNEPIQHLFSEHVQSLTDYPPVQKAATFDFSAIMEQLMSGKQ